jgi:hypothetical protein
MVVEVMQIKLALLDGIVWNMQGSVGNTWHTARQSNDGPMIQ